MSFGVVAVATVALMETLTMSQKERRRIGIMASVKAKELNLVEAAQVLGLVPSDQRVGGAMSRR